MFELNCPYCEKDCVASSDLRDQEVLYEHECEHCGKAFCYFIQYEPYYTSWKAPCLNGGEHNYQKIHGCPEEYFKNRRRCEYCENEIEV